MNPLLSCGAALLVVATAAAQSPDPFQPLVHVEYGRAVLVQRGSRGELLLPETERHVDGIAYLLVGAGARASVTWRGQSSLLLHGPTEIEWSPGDAESGSMDPTWSVLRLGEIDVEVRRGEPELKLPGGWHTRLGEGAFYVSGNGRDACDLEVRAGAPLALRPELRGGRVRPPVSVSTGMRVRLSDRHIAVSRPDATADARSWNRVSWPWRTGTNERFGDETRGDATVAGGRESVSIEPSAPSVTMIRPMPRSAPVVPRPVTTVTFDLDQHTSLPFFVEPESSWSAGSSQQQPDTRTGDTPPPETSPIDFRSRPVAVEPVAESPTEPVTEEAPEPTFDPGTYTIPGGPPPVARPLPRRSPEPTPEPPKPVVTQVEVTKAEPATPPMNERSTEPAPEPKPVVARRPEPVETRREPEPAPQPRREVKPEPERTRPGTRRSAAFVVTQWRGTSFDELEAVGEAAVTRSSSVRSTRIDSTRWRIALAARAEGPVWFFGKDEDIELQPGASVTITEDGFVQSRQGLTRSVPAPAGRPAFGELD